jgi:hypothetical protein
VDIKRYAVEYMERCGSFAYTRAALEELKTELLAEVALLGGHPDLVLLLTYLHAQVSDKPKPAESGDKGPAGGSSDAEHCSGAGGREAAAGLLRPSGLGASCAKEIGAATGAPMPPSSFPRIDSL